MEEIQSIKLKDSVVPETVRNGRILLHSCCAPCSTAILEWMAENDLHPCVFFSNSNIVPLKEYEHRLSEMIRYASALGFETVADEYDHGAWLDWVRRQEKEHGSIADMPERGIRCLECFKYRLYRAAGYASSHGFTVLTTTLASSRWKDLLQVDEAGRYACESFASVRWWGQNWRKGGLQERRGCLIKECGLYNQEYCGCEFSLRDSRDG